MSLVSRYEQLVDKRRSTLATIRRGKGKLRALKAEREKLLKGREVLLIFLNQLQASFKGEVESLLTMAINSVLQDETREYEFRLEFKERKDRVEVLPVVLQGKLELRPKDNDLGRGAMPVMGFPLRVILLGKSRPMIWMDEPVKGALGRDDDLLARTIKMFKEISRKVGIQVILNTHETDFAGLADRVVRFEHDGVKTVAKVIKPRQRVKVSA